MQLEQVQLKEMCIAVVENRTNKNSVPQKYRKKVSIIADLVKSKIPSISANSRMKVTAENREARISKMNLASQRA